MARALFALLSFLCCITLSVQTTGILESSAEAEPALQRFLTRADEPLKQYRALRRLEAHNERFKMHGTLAAMTELSASGDFTYTILSESGSERILNKVLRPLLEAESKVLASGDPSRSALTTDNYEIGGGQVSEPGIVKLFARPRRKDISLIDGSVFITSDESDLVRVEGRMAKNPSFWTSRVNVVRHYARIGGIRVPVRLDSTAQVKVVGESSLSIHYDYESINGVALPQ